MTDAYAWWRAALDGVTGPISDGDPQPGFYRTRRQRGGPWLPAAIWIDEHGAAQAVVGADYEPTDPDAIWIACAKHPVPEADYRAACESGQWPGDAPAPARGMGDNAPPETIEDRIAASIETAEAWLDKVGEIGDTATGDQCANMRAALLALIKDADAQRDAEKRPHLEAGRAVDAKWRPVIDGCKAVADRLRAALTPWLRKLEDEKRARAAEQIAQGATVARADTAARAGGATGKRASLRTQRRAVIEDYPAALQFFAEHPEVKELVQRLANKVAAVNGTVPGVKISTEQVAA